jgi:hypothetical protein
MWVNAKTWNVINNAGLADVLCHCVKFMLQQCAITTDKK